jgi:aminoglycoside 3-N-acetyltransferase
MASRIVANHELADPCGQTSPLGLPSDLDARVLLLGVGYQKCTALHLAEDRSLMSFGCDDGQSM